MEGYTKIGRIRPNYTGAWNAETAYTVLDMVKNEAGTASYIAKQDVPAGAPLANEAYWAMVLDAGDAIEAAEQAAADANKAAQEYSELDKKVDQLSEEIADETKNRQNAISQEITARNAAIAQERNRAVERENEIEELFSRPTQEAVSKWLDEHPEATTTVLDASLGVEKFTENAKKHIVKDYVTPEMFGAKGDGVTDDSTAIQDAIDTGKPVRFGSKCYGIGKTIEIEGVYRTETDGKSVAGCNTTFIALANIPMLSIKKCHSNISDIFFDVSKIDYSEKVIVLNAVDSPIFGNVIRNIQLYNGFKKWTGTGIYLNCDEGSYVYGNTFDDVKIENFDIALSIDSEGREGCNCNLFENFVYWSDTKAIVCHGAMNTFTGTCQASNNMEKGNTDAVSEFYGNHNTVNVSYMDIGLDTTAKYGDSTHGESRDNVFLQGFNPVCNYSKKEQLYNKNLSDLLFTDNAPLTKYTGTNETLFTPLNYIGMDNNFLGMNTVESATMEIDGEVIRQTGLIIANGNSIKSLLAPNLTEFRCKGKVGSPYTITFTIKLKAQNTSTAFFTGIIDALGVIGSQSEIGIGSRAGGVEVSVYQTLLDGTVLEMEDITNLTQGTGETSACRMYRIKPSDKTYENIVKRTDFITIRIYNPMTVEDNSTRICITGIFANYTNYYYRKHSPYLPLLGGAMDGDVRFNGGAGVILQASNGNYYKLTVGDDGSIKTERYWL